MVLNRREIRHGEGTRGTSEEKVNSTIRIDGRHGTATSGILVQQRVEIGVENLQKKVGYIIE